MYLIAGLGNPERKYDNTKHNIGFDALDEIIDAFGIPSGGVSMKGMYGKGLIGGEKVMLLKPLTYMNLSGNAIKAYIDYYKLDPKTELIVIYDDVDLEIGQLRIRKRGSAGSHNGMKSIVEKLGSDEFIRIRVGIGPKPEKWDLADYVLAPFSKSERARIDERIEKMPDIVREIITNGADSAMNRYNSKEDKDTGEER